MSQVLLVLNPLFALLIAISAAMYNARLNRKRDEYLRLQEKRNLWKAIYVEIGVCITQLELLKGIVQDILFLNVQQNSRPSKYLDAKVVMKASFPSKVYDALLARIGLFDMASASAIIRFYANLAKIQREYELFMRMAPVQENVKELSAQQTPNQMYQEYFEEVVSLFVSSLDRAVEDGNEVREMMKYDIKIIEDHPTSNWKRHLWIRRRINGN